MSHDAMPVSSPTAASKSGSSSRTGWKIASAVSTERRSAASNPPPGPVIWSASRRKTSRRRAASEAKVLPSSSTASVQVGCHHRDERAVPAHRCELLRERIAGRTRRQVGHQFGRLDEGQVVVAPIAPWCAVPGLAAKSQPRVQPCRRAVSPRAPWPSGGTARAGKLCPRPGRWRVHRRGRRPASPSGAEGRSQPRLAVARRPGTGHGRRRYRRGTPLPTAAWTYRDRHVR